MDIGGGELAGFFTGDFEVRGASVGANGGEDRSGLDFPRPVRLDECKIGIFVNGSDATDELGFFCLWLWGGCFDGLFRAGGEEEEYEEGGSEGER